MASPDDLPRIGEFLEELAARGMRTQVVSAAEGRRTPTVLVVLSPRLAADAEVDSDLRRLVDGSATNVLPVLLEGPVDLLSDVSQIYLSRGVGLAAQRVELLTIAGPAALVSWNDLTSRAREWDESGRPRARLLGTSDTQSALRLLAGPLGRVDSANSGLLRLLAQESRGAASRRSTALRVAGAVTAVVLVGGTTLALYQRAAAQRAQREATEQANRSSATRLSALASDLVEFDPDLPWVYSQLALDRMPSTETVDFAVALSTSGRPHRTIPLRAVPFDLDVAADLAVVDLGDAGLDAFDVTSGDLVHSDPTLRFDSVELSPDSRTLVGIDDNGDAVVLDTESWTDAWPIELPAAVTDIDASPDGHAALLSPSGITLIDLNTGVLRVLPLPDELRDATQVALADDGIYVADDIRVASLDVASGLLVDELVLPQAGVTELHAAEFSVIVLGVRQLTVVDRKQLTGDGLNDTDTDYEPSTRAGTTSASTIVDAAMLGGDETGGVSVIDASTGSSYQYVRAHRGAVTGVGQGGDGTLVTVGYDRAMRLWEPRMIANLNPSPFGYDGYVVAGFEESHRNLIVAAPGTDLATISVLDKEETVVIDRRTLEAIDRGRAGGLLDATRPTVVPGKVYSVRTNSGELLVKDLTSRTVSSTEIPVSILGWQFLTGASADGEWYALADSARLLVRAPGGSISVTELTETIDPVAVWVDNDGAASVIDSHGAVHTSSGERHQIRIGSRPIAVALSIAEERYVVATADGDVLEITGSEARLVRAAGANNRPEVMRLSPDGRYLALIGPDTTDIITMEGGALRARLTSWMSAPVSDVAFDDDSNGGVLVRSSGVVERFEVLPSEAVASFIEGNQPRDVTEADLELAKVDGEP